MTTNRTRRYTLSDGVNGIADLHIHSNYSDGTLSPAEIVSAAVEAGLSAIAITDHDCVDGVQHALEAARDELEIIPGVELSTIHDGREVHILGLMVDVKNRALRQHLESTNAERRRRIHEISHRLTRLDIRIDPEEVLRIAGRGSPGRLHVARALVRNGHAATISEAFRNYIGDDCPAYVPRETISTKEGIELILEAGGVPVMAHPVLTRADEIIPALVRYGLKGLEAFYPGQSEVDCLHYLRIAEKHNLVVSGGSDSHGIESKNDSIGRVRISWRCVEELKKLARRG